MGWSDRTRERFTSGSRMAVILLVIAVIALLIGLFLLKNTGPG
jgi:hypothetical protein